MTRVTDGINLSIQESQKVIDLKANRKICLLNGLRHSAKTHIIGVGDLA